MSWASAVPTWCWWVLALLLVGGGQQYRVMGLQQGVALEQKAFSDHIAEDESARAQAVADARTEEQRRISVVEGIESEARGRIEAAQADAVAAGTAADGLRREVDRLRASRGATCNTITAQQRAAGTEPIDLLADVLERADRRAGELAAALDRSRIAGEACEQAYDSVRASVKPLGD